VNKSTFWIDCQGSARDASVDNAEMPRLEEALIAALDTREAEVRYLACPSASFELAKAI
jgi:hypothetical protein